ncbi:hypothetical protein Tco_1407772 [Tanacetum coccineum]
MFPTLPLFASVTNGIEKPTVETSLTNANIRALVLDDQDLINVEDPSMVLLVKLKDVNSMSNMHAICRNEDFTELEIRHVGGFWIWIQFPSSSLADNFQTNASLKSVYSCIKSATPSFKVGERMIWIEIRGLPLSEESTEMSSGRICISTKLHNFVSERVLVEVHGVNYDVHVHELGTWNINIIDETLDSSDNLDANGMEKVEDSIDENSLADLNDLKETINKLASNKIQHLINKENMDKENDINKVSPEIPVSSNLSRPPGFEHMKRKSSKCSTSFARYRNKDIKGVSLIEELSRIIKVGDSLDPSQIKEEFLNFFKEKFKDHDLNMDFPPVTNSSGLCVVDRDSLETPVSLEEVKNAVWDCGSSKAPGPDGACLSSSRDSVLVNGSPTSKFSIKCGLKQVDPLLPFLFILVMEGLHNALSTVVISGLIRGVKFGDPEVTISHLFYVDDKSNVYGIGVLDVDVSSMSSNSGCASGSFLFTYLGLPIGSNMSLTSSWQVLLDRFQSKLSLWKANLLSIGGRYTLIKAVLGSLGIYYFSIFKVPESVIISLERSRAMLFREVVLKLLTLPFSKSGVGGCYRTRTRSRLKLSKLYMARKVALITMVASIMVVARVSISGKILG